MFNNKRAIDIITTKNLGLDFRDGLVLISTDTNLYKLPIGDLRTLEALFIKYIFISKTAQNAPVVDEQKPENFAQFDTQETKE